MFGNFHREAVHSDTRSLCVKRLKLIFRYWCQQEKEVESNWNLKENNDKKEKGKVGNWLKIFPKCNESLYSTNLRADSSVLQLADLCTKLKRAFHDHTFKQSRLREELRFQEVCIFPEMNPDSLTATWLPNIKQVAACNIQISLEAPSRSDRICSLSAPMIATISQCCKNKSNSFDGKDFLKNVACPKTFPVTTTISINNMFEEEKYFSILAAKMVGRK